MNFCKRFEDQIGLCQRPGTKIQEKNKILEPKHEHLGPKI